MSVSLAHTLPLLVLILVLLVACSGQASRAGAPPPTTGAQPNLIARRPLVSFFVLAFGLS